MDEENGTTAIDAASTYDADFIGQPEWTSGKIGHALAFDGQTDELAVPPINLGDGTIAAWVKWDTKSVLMAGSDYQEGYWLHFEEGSSLVKINWGGKYRSFRDVFEVGEWTHVAMTREGSVLRLYKNGELTETVQSGSTGRATIRGIGALYAQSGAFQRFDGLLDEIRIYDRALSSTEIKELHGSESDVQTPDSPADEAEESQGGTFDYSVVLYASPEGSGAADGTQQYPFTIKQALDLANSQTEAILLKAGSYPGPHFYSHEFSRSTPLVIRSAPGGLAVLDGAFTRSGGGIRWQDIEFAADGWPDRQTSTSGSELIDMPDLGFTITARDEFVNSIIHDHSNNGFWSTAENLLVYGCLFYNQGWNAPDRGHGHAAYMQNLNGTKSFERNVLVRGFSRQTIQAYGSSNASLRGFNFKENVSIGGRWLVGGGSPVARLSMTGNHIQGVAQLGYGTGVVNEDATLVGNVLSQQVARVGSWLEYSESGTLFSEELDEVFVYDNAFDPDRGLVVVYNAALKPSVSVDLTSLPLTAGDTYRFVNALNPAEGHEFVYNKEPVTLPMNEWSVAIPTAWDVTLIDASFPSFGAFLIVGADRYTSSSKLAAAIQESDEHSNLSGDTANDVAGQFVLDRIYPNPFNPSTTIPFSLTVRSEVDISVYDVMGREIAILARGSHSAGDHMVRFDASGLPSGVYLVRARVRGSMGRVHVLSRMITLLK